MGKLKIDFVLIDESVVMNGFRALMSGAKLDGFIANPVMLFMHNRADGGALKTAENDSMLPIGRWYDIRIENNKLLAKPDFDDNDVFAQKIESKVKGGYLNASSIWLDPIAASDAAALRIEGQSGVTVTKWGVLEASIVDIPNCRNSLAIRNSAGKKITLNGNAETIEANQYLKTLVPSPEFLGTERFIDIPGFGLMPILNATFKRNMEGSEKQFKDERAELNEEPRSSRVQHLMSKSFRELYVKGELPELERLHVKAFHEKYKEGTGKDHPNAAKTAGEHLEKIDEKEQPYTEEVHDLMKRSYRDLYMDGGLESLKQKNIHAFYKKYKEGIGKFHPDSEEAKMEKEGKKIDSSKLSLTEYEQEKVKDLMAKSWTELYRNGEGESLRKLDKNSFYAKFKEGTGTEYPQNLRS